MTHTASEQDRFLNQVAGAISRRGLRFPALIALDAGRPLTFLLGQFLWVAQPALSLFGPSQALRQTARLLENPEAVAALIAHLEAIPHNQPPGGLEHD
ncbi:MAG: hypothetical protein GY803_26830 [Chloroflexi bacterium]|nr:hypothetical protein [Chloroflexota bacterium]